MVEGSGPVPEHGLPGDPAQPLGTRPHQPSSAEGAPWRGREGVPGSPERGLHMHHVHVCRHRHECTVYMHLRIHICTRTHMPTPPHEGTVHIHIHIRTHRHKHACERTVPVHMQA